MRVHPQIAALRSDDAPQRHAQAAMEQAVGAWRDECGIAAIKADLDRFGAGAPLEQCPALEALFTAKGRAEADIAALVGHLCQALSANPLGHPPFSSGFDGGASTVMLGQSGRAHLVLQAREPGSVEWQSASYFDTVRYDAVLAGHAEAAIVRIHGPDDHVSFTSEPMILQTGVRLAFDCARETLQPVKVTRRLVTLRLLQDVERPRPGREYCRRTGRLLHRASGTRANSRRELMAALLGRMGRVEAAPLLAQMALAEHDLSLRWQALRECLALDVAEGFPTLSAIAALARDELSGPAGALRAQLVEAHPQLLQLEAGQCPA